MLLRFELSLLQYPARILGDRDRVRGVVQETYRRRTAEDPVRYLKVLTPGSLGFGQDGIPASNVLCRLDNSHRLHPRGQEGPEEQRRRA